MPTRTPLEKTLDERFQNSNHYRRSKKCSSHGHYPPIAYDWFHGIPRLVASTVQNGARASLTGCRSSRLSGRHRGSGGAIQPDNPDHEASSAAICSLSSLPVSE
jgi:hypothetical protein